MIIGTVSENKELEKRISITPDIAKKYISNGFEVMIEKDLASHLGISDKDFIEEGCKIDSRENVLNKLNIILQLNLPDENESTLVQFESFHSNKITSATFGTSLWQDGFTEQKLLVIGDEEGNVYSWNYNQGNDSNLTQETRMKLDGGYFSAPM